MTQTQPCPCGSEKTLAQCCLPYLEGKASVPTAEALLRSRYTAYTQANVDYILATHHSSTRDEIDPKEVKDWAEDSEWLGLKILHQEAGQPSDDEGSLVFHVQYKNRSKEEQKDEVIDHWEKSFFKKEKGNWMFVDAQALQPGPIRRTEPKIGRNDPCSCGSGKKFKKCHGA